jgi:hypothetical protein
MVIFDSGKTRANIAGKRAVYDEMPAESNRWVTSTCVDKLDLELSW